MCQIFIHLNIFTTIFWYIEEKKQRKKSIKRITRIWEQKRPQESGMWWYKTHNTLLKEFIQGLWFDYWNLLDFVAPVIDTLLGLKMDLQGKAE